MNKNATSSNTKMPAWLQRHGGKMAEVLFLCLLGTLGTLSWLVAAIFFIAAMGLIWAVGMVFSIDLPTWLFIVPCLASLPGFYLGVKLETQK